MTPSAARRRQRNSKTGWNHGQTNNLRINPTMQTADESGRPRPPPTANQPSPGRRHGPEDWSAS